MQYTSSILLSAAALAVTVSAHGQISAPAPRMPGTAMQAACGAQVYSMQSSDSYGNIQGELQIANSQSDYNAAACNVWLCKGYQFADTTNIETYTAGQVVPITVEIRAPHTGTANVSIVSTKSNTMISSILAYWPVYASTATSIPANNTQFSITMPDLGSQCVTAGDCVIQWWWDARSIDQTYESCVDFTMGGSGSSSASGSAAPAASTAAPVASSAAAAPAATQPIVASVQVAVAASSQAPVTTPAAAVTITPTTLRTVVASSTVAPTTPATSTDLADAISTMPAGTTLTTLLKWLSTMLDSMLSSTS